MNRGIISQNPNIPPPVSHPAPVMEFWSTSVSLFISSIIPIIGGVGLVAGSYFLEKNKKILEEIQKKINKEDELNLLPPEEIGRVKDILAQISVITDAERVTLGVFHNGVIGANKVSFDRMAIVAGYTSPGVLKLPELGKDVKFKKLMADLDLLWDSDQGVLFLRKADANQSCKLYFSRRDISLLVNIRLSLGEIDMGVISLHWCGNCPHNPFPPEDSRGANRMEDLKSEILGIIQAARDRERILGE